MPAIAQDVTLYKGDSLVITISVLDQAGNPVDLTGASARWWMGKNANAIGSDVYIKKSSAETQIDESGATVNQIDVDQSTGGATLVIRLLPTDTETALSGVAPGAYYHETEVVNAIGKIATVTIGKFLLKPTVVRNA